MISMMVVEAGTITAALVGRNFLPLMMLFVEWLVLPDACTPITWQACFSLVTIGVGTVLYTFFDLKATRGWWSVLYLSVNMIATVVQRILERRTLVDSSMTLSIPAMGFVTQTTCLFIAACATILSHEHLQWSWHSGPQVSFWGMIWQHPYAVACILLSGCTAVSLNTSSVLVQKQVSATSMLVLQTSTKALTVLLAMAIFRDKLAWMMALGCIASVAGCAWYGSVSQKPADTTQCLKKASATVEGSHASSQDMGETASLQARLQVSKEADDR